ncbi:MAG TPA: 4Fe-4S binding protein [Thermoanaerobaculaceae bacterium]|nr:4Fe-4S binding protein [Thermoanaerobaculaceae bacterium]
MSRLAFTFDPVRCTGCEACRIACATENRLPVGLGWRRVHTLNPNRHPAVPVRHLSMACNHCEVPACLAACPAAAYTRDEATGAVLLDQTRCLGCGYCAWVCPYGAPQLDESNGVMSKCTFCAPRLAEGRGPACVACCPTGALGVGPRAQGMTPVYPGVFSDGLGPALSIAEPRLPVPPETTAPPTPAGAATVAARPVVPRRVTLATEWPLAVLTFMAAVLVAVTTAAVLGGPSVLPWWGVAGLGGGAMAVSAAHLGRKERAWRAGRQLRSSFLTLEILGFSGFLALAVAFLGMSSRAPMVGWAAVVIGALTLVAIDRLYQVPFHRGLPLHSALTLLAAVFLVGVLVPVPPVVVAAASVKLALIAWRQVRRPSTVARAAVEIVRIGVGLLVPMLGVLGVISLPNSVALGTALLGEALDRLGFYADFAPPSPEGEMRLAFSRALDLRH